MFDTCKLAFAIDFNYKINTFIYRLRKIPFIGKLFPSDLYRKEDLKRCVRILYILFAILCELSKKILYVLLFLYLPLQGIKGDHTSSFVHIFLCITTLGAFINTQILKAQSKKYYAVLLMGMDAKRYVQVDFIFYLCKTILSFIPALLLFMILGQVSIYLIVPLLLFMILIKAIGEAVSLFIYSKYKYIISDRFVSSTILSILFLGIGYVLPIFMNVSVPIYSIYIGILITLLPVFYSLQYVRKFTEYRKVYKEVVTLNKIMFNREAATASAQQTQLKIDSKDLSIDTKVTGKKGYDYFNTIFFRRHRRILLESAKKMGLICFGIFLIAAVFLYFNPEGGGQLHKIIMTWLPYFVFLMYLINRGSVVTQAMFFNCDHSMLAYNFYRSPKTIINVFMTRLKTVILVNLIPSIVIALGLPILLYMSGGTPHYYIYVSLFLSILFMSIFFSVHHLILYYLLQPYDINMSAKSSMYAIASTVTYVACYMCMKIRIDTGVFSLGVIAVTIIYILLSLYLVYKFAPKTFRLK